MTDPAAPEPTEPEETRDGDHEYEFDVAVSFAGEDRALVDEIVDLAQEHDVRAFYDEDYKVETWGKDLIEYFTDLYQHRARFAIVFISRHYATKVWPRVERRSILARAMNEHAEYVLPVRLDDTELEGLLPTVGYLDARREGVKGIADAIVQKVSGAAPERTEWTTGVPTGDAENQSLLAIRPRRGSTCTTADCCSRARRDSNRASTTWRSGLRNSGPCSTATMRSTT